ISRTTTRISVVPDLGGDPPSKAVSVKLSSGSFSRSRDWSSTSSGYFLPSSLSCNLRWKWGLGLIV
uniref:Uncharacterized protein n=1 Tax=Prolemur simus TaxID=1328070 RepID=A0A8C9AJ95_PROSS